MNNCKNCGNPTPNKKYCSRDCSNAVTALAKRVVYSCHDCGVTVSQKGVKRCRSCRNHYNNKLSKLSIAVTDTVGSSYDRKKLYMAKYMRKRKLDYINYLGGKCKKCGYNKSPWGLDIHHRNPGDKKFGFAGKSMSWEKAIPELDKCDLLCKNCHVEEHYKDTTSVNQRKRIKERAVKHLGGCCNVCGYDSYIQVLEFHHLDPGEKDPSVSLSGKYGSWENLKVELDKCMLLCRRCHSEEHHRQFLETGVSLNKLR